jgi:hypothetical protein
MAVVAIAIVWAIFAVTPYVQETARKIDAFRTESLFVENWHRIRIGGSLRDAENVIWSPATEVPVPKDSKAIEPVRQVMQRYRWIAPSCCTPGQNVAWIDVVDGRVVSTEIHGPCSLGMYRGS